MAKQPKRTFVLKGIGQEMVISKVTAIKKGPKVLHFDELKDGTYRLIYNSNMIPDFTKVEGIEIVRED